MRPRPGPADIDSFAHSIFLFLSAGLDLFEEVAKFRAARRMWHTCSRTASRHRPESLAANIFCYTLGSPQTAEEPLNNIVRISYQALAAVLGGVQTLATSSYDEALGLPGPRRPRLACAPSRSWPTRPESHAPPTRSEARISSRT